ncbi:hypothetical protein [Micromonospora aurantiaca (nom. illeg.)]|uniref:hypothetical protein n=1 Tax=Micromonospora aurantiaca (nom. illeg.) TaxID=47850 RepID=UPI003F49F667
MGRLYQRPSQPMTLQIKPELASWERAGHPSQVRLSRFLDHVATLAEPVGAGVDGPLAIEMVVGLPENVTLIAGGRDLDNFLCPVAQRIGAGRLAAVFGRKVHAARSSLAVGPAVPQAGAPVPQFTTHMVGSYEDKPWKEELRDRLLAAHLVPADPGPVWMQVSLTTGPGRTWTNLWKPLLDSFGPVLGADPAHPFSPYDDRIVDLGLHHAVDASLGHGVSIDAWWGVHGSPCARELGQ